MKIYPPDGLISWLVALACFYLYFISMGLNRVVGLLFVDVKNFYNISRSEASYPFSVAYMAENVAGPIAGYLGHRFSPRIPILIGCCTASLGYHLCFWAPNIVSYTIFFGVLGGAGKGLTLPLLPKIIKLYFKKHLSKALGLYGSGTCAFALLAPTFEKFIHHFGNSAAVLLLSGIIMQGIPIALLLKDPQYWCNIRNIKHGTTKTKLQTLTNNKKASLNIKDNPDTKIYNIKTTNNILYKHDFKVEPVVGLSMRMFTDSAQTINSSFTKAAESATGQKLFSNASNVTSTEKQEGFEINSNIPENSFTNSRDLLSSKSYTGNSILNVNGLEDLSSMSTKSTSEGNSASNDNERLNSNHDLSSVLTENTTKTTKKNTLIQMLGLWIDPIFLVFSVIRTIDTAFFVIIYIIFVDHFIDKGLSVPEAANLIIYYGAADFVSRLSFGWVTDGGYMKRNHYSAMCLFLRAMSLAYMALCQGFVMSIISPIILGIGHGTYVPSSSAVILQFVPEQKQTLVFANITILSIPVGFAVPPMISYFRKTFGSYNELIFSLVAMHLFACILILMLPLVERCKLKKTDN